MHYRSAYTLLLSVSLVFNCSVAGSGKTQANEKVFDLLLGLYKINPLKRSPVYQSFSNNLLVGMGKRFCNKDGYALNFVSSESVKKEVQVHLNEIEKVIHTRNKKTENNFEEPAYDLNDIGAEDFKADLVVNDTILSKEGLNTNFQYNIMKEDFSALFEHIIGSKEVDNENNVTRLHLVNDTVVRKSQLANQNEVVVELPETKSIRDINLVETPKDNLEYSMQEVISI